MYIIGVSAYYHDSSACLFKNGELLFACEEEKFTGIKHDSSFPHKTIEYIFKTYIQPLGQIGKEKTPEEKEKSKIEVNQIYADIKQLLSNQPEFDTIEQAKTKITKFINK